MGRLWQSLILSRWKPLFADLPIERRKAVRHIQSSDRSRTTPDPRLVYTTTIRYPAQRPTFTHTIPGCANENGLDSIESKPLS